MGEHECSGGIGDVKRMARSHERADYKPHWTESSWIPLATIAVIVISIFVTWATLDAILVNAIPIGQIKH
ncbi:hypothetical protein [Burkholderia sp. BCC1988]|uniref:hypothetical protein n=1 Tax=Burkholderia sp. BCC1988 TaxID=2817443 RepID=UPI002AB03566|nr:hypothetical protein [Burkholderia sp. BCC1988]